MNHFRADAVLLAQMIDKDVLRYSKDNRAQLLTVFKIPARQASQQNKNQQNRNQNAAGKSASESKFYTITVMLFDELAESLNKSDNPLRWYEIRGKLLDHSPEYEQFRFPKLSIKADSIDPIPPMGSSVFECQLIGRLTRDPEKIIKNDFAFERFSLAVNRQDKASFFEISVFKPNLIESVNATLKKGQPIYASGDVSMYDKGENSAVQAAIKLENFSSFIHE